MTTLFSNGFAIFIGVGADLPVTTTDAQALHNLFIHPERAAYSPDRVKLLIEKDATRDNILTTLDTFAIQLSQDPNATMIVYFSGHGGYFSQAEAKEYFLLPHDYDASRREDTTISGDEFTRKIEALKAKRLVILLDCCHAGGMFGAKGVEETFEKAPLPPTLLHVLETGSGQGIIASSLEAEKSYYDSSHSIFTACLLDALSGKGARKNDGFARFLDVILYLMDEVPKRALIQGSQHPFINKIQGVSNNFPLCYVEGGSKAIPFQEEPLAPKSNLSAGKRQRLEEDKSRLQQERSIHAEKLRLLRNEWAFETSVAHRYQQEQQILGAESRLTQLDRQLDELEERLALSEVKDKEFLPIMDNQKSPFEVPEASPPKENSSVMLLTEMEQQKLVDLPYDSYTFSLPQIMPLVQKLMECTYIKDLEARQVIIDNLNPKIAHAIRYHSDIQIHVTRIVRACLNYEGGMDELIDILQMYENKSIQIRDVKAAWNALRLITNRHSQ